MANGQIYSRIKFKRDTSANWTSADPVILNGEIILVDTQEGELRAKIGDGVKTYTQLPFSDEIVRNLVTQHNNSATAHENMGWINTEEEEIPTSIPHEIINADFLNGYDETDFAMKTELTNYATTSDLVEINSNIDNANSNINSTKSNLQSQINTLTGEINNNKSNIQELQNLSSTVDNQQISITQLQEQIPTITENQTNMQANITDLYLKSSTNKADISDLNTSINQVNETITTLQNNMITSDSPEITNINSNINTITSDVTTAKSNISTLQSDVTTAKSNISTLQSDVSQAKTNITSLESSKLNKTGGTLTGALVAQNNTNYTTKQVRNIFLSTSQPSSSSGSNGDIWIVYET